jgi:hypothetical protein
LEDALRAVQHAADAVASMRATVQADQEYRLATNSAAAIGAPKDDTARLTKSARVLDTAIQGISSAQQRLAALQRSGDASPFGTAPPPSLHRSAPLADVLLTARPLLPTNHLWSQLTDANVEKYPTPSTLSQLARPSSASSTAFSAASSSASTSHASANASSTSNAPPPSGLLRAAALSSWAHLDESLSDLLPALLVIHRQCTAAFNVMDPSLDDDSSRGGRSQTRATSPSAAAAATATVSARHLASVLASVRGLANHVGEIVALLPPHPLPATGAATRNTLDAQHTQHESDAIPDPSTSVLRGAASGAVRPGPAVLMELRETLTSKRPAPQRLKEGTCLCSSS